MRFEAHVDGVPRALEVERGANGSLRVLLDGRTFDVEVAETGANLFSILIGNDAFEARVLPAAEGYLVHCAGSEFHVQLRDPRAWRASRGSVLEVEGRQQVAASMPGKVIRVLVAAGEAVEAGQGVVVIEAMKMQNEMRAPKGGIVERVCAVEGQTVSAGEPLVIIA